MLASTKRVRFTPVPDQRPPLADDARRPQRVEPVNGPERARATGGANTLRLRLVEDGRRHPRMCLLGEPFRLGFGAQCDIRLEGGQGPDVVFEVEQTPGSLLVARAVAPAECENYLELRVDGQPLGGTERGLAPGSHLEIVEKASGRRYDVTVESTPRPRFLRARSLALIIAVLAVAGAAFGGYLFWSLEGARTELTRTGSALQQARAELERIQQRVRESLRSIETTEASLRGTVDELRRLGEASTRSIRAEFTERIQRIEQESRRELDRLAERDVEGRAELLQQARAQAEALRSEFSERMVESYRELRALEKRLLASMTERLSAREPDGERFKRIFARVGAVALLIRTTYRVEFKSEDGASEAVSFGSGFVVSSSGLALTAQHVLFPWRYDREFLVLERLGLVRVVPDSVRWQAWPSGAQALRDPVDPASVDADSAYGSHEGKAPLLLLHAPEPEVNVQVVSSPLGAVEIPVPVPGASDSAVVQLVDFSAPMVHLAPSADTPVPATLDEVLLVGYPLSLLQDGVARPQGIRGFVRRLSEGLLELDAAVHPGLSGGLVVDREGALVGMVTATLNSDVYGVALPLDTLMGLLDDARARVREEEARLEDAGCEPGDVDGLFDARTWEGYRCESRRGRAAPG